MILVRKTNFSHMQIFKSLYLCSYKNAIGLFQNNNLKFSFYDLSKFHVVCSWDPNKSQTLPSAKGKSLFILTPFRVFVRFKRL